MRVQVIRGLIEQVGLHLLREQRRHRHAPQLPAGERVGAPLRELAHVDLRERLARHALILGALPLPQRQVRVAPDEHGLEHRGHEGLLEVLRQQAQAQRERAPRQLRERRAAAEDRAGRRCPQSCERVQASGSCPSRCGRGSPPAPRARSGSTAPAPARARPRARSAPARRGRRGRAAITGRIHRISSAVAGPTTTCRRLRGISPSVADSGRRPAMISVASCG